jgi:3-hydroxyacyl-CoA dehydrogenase
MNNPGPSRIAELIAENRRIIERDYAGASQIEIKHLGVVGAGLMGVRIAAMGRRSGLPVTVVDRDPEAVRLGPERVESVVRELVDDQAPHTPVAANSLRFASDYSAFADCDLVIESVPEKPPLKMAVFAELQGEIGPDTILATNTSTIPIGNLAGSLNRPERFCGLHFFAPLTQQPMVEVIPGPQTGREAIAKGIAFCRRIRHLPLVVRDGPGFLVNRLLMSYQSAGLDLLLAGVDLLDIERAARDFGALLGPFRMYDEIGLDVCFHGGFMMAGTAGHLVVKSPLLVKMIKGGHLGRKAGRGFFAYDDAPAASGHLSPNPEAQAIIARWAAPTPAVANEAVSAGLVLPMVMEATRLLDEGRAGDPGQIDLAVTCALGFPQSRGGLLYWADTVGAAEMIEMLEPLADIGPRFQPSKTLLDMAAGNRRFHAATL